MANVVQVAWARYLRQLEREPLKTKVSLVAFTIRYGTLITMQAVCVPYRLSLLDRLLL